MFAPAGRVVALAALLCIAAASPGTLKYARSKSERARIAGLRDTASLRDQPVAGTGSAQYLDGEDWVITSADGKVGPLQGYVPGDLLTDLQLSGVIGDPIYEQNWLQWQYDGEAAPLWDAQNFTYTKTFDSNISPTGNTIWLFFDGVKMAADINLNGIALGTANDMFLRVSFDVTSTLRATGNVLTVTFSTSSDVRNGAGRWPACS